MVFQTLKWSRYPGDPGSAQERSGGLRNQSSKRKVKKKKKNHHMVLRYYQWDIKKPVKSVYVKIRNNYQSENGG